MLYVSPLKALAVDVEGTCARPAGIALAAQRLGAAARDVAVGDADRRHTREERRTSSQDPPDILITTPESLYLMLTSQARETLPA